MVDGMGFNVSAVFGRIVIWPGSVTSASQLQSLNGFTGNWQLTTGNGFCLSWQVIA